MDRRAFIAGMAATMFVPAARVGHARGSDEVRPLERLYAETTIHFEARTRRFMVHEPLKTGEWQHARETIGPQRGGVVGNMELRTGKYLGADRKSTRLNSSHLVISYAVFCLKKKKKRR